MSLGAYARLARLGPIIRTGEAAAALDTSLSQASRSLRTIEAQGLAMKVRRGLWLVGTDPIDPRRLAEEIARPYPAYVSFLSAMNAHGMIDQVPRHITIASLDSAKQVRTPVGTYAVHHLPPELFDGWSERNGVKLAESEKLLFDLAYVSAVHRGRVRNIPELDLPPSFDHQRLEHWLRRIRSSRIQTLTRHGLSKLLDRATRLPHPIGTRPTSRAETAAPAHRCKRRFGEPARHSLSTR
jgi:predicted transcriptional regulator of viral defense system